MLNFFSPLKTKLIISAFLTAFFFPFYLFLSNSQFLDHWAFFLFLAFFAPIVYFYFLTIFFVGKIIFFIDKLFYSLKETDFAYDWVFYSLASLLIFSSSFYLISFFQRWTAREKNQIKLKKIKEFLRPNQTKISFFLIILLILPMMHWLAEIESLFPLGFLCAVLVNIYQTITSFVPAGIIYLLQLIFSSPTLPNTDEEEARMFFYLLHNLIFSFSFHFFLSYFLACKFFQSKKEKKRTIINSKK